MNRFFLSSLLLAFSIAACSGNDITGPGGPPVTITISPASTTIDALDGTHTFQAVVRDARGRIVPDISVEWLSSSSEVAAISAAGTATAIANGTTEITARAGSIETSTTLVVQQRVASLSKVRGDNQISAPAAQLPVQLSVSARDRNDYPVPGATIAFEVSGNGGSVSPANATTNDAGEAHTSWTLSSAVSTSHTVTARATNVSGVQARFSATATAGVPATSAFDIELRFVTAVSSAQRAAFTSAAAKWQSIIWGDLPRVSLNLSAGDCGSNSPAFNESVDDLVIFVSVQDIDGAGDVLGQASPCRIRGSSLLPIAGLMLFDAADVAGLEADGLLEDVILHEMGHVLGIGTLWPTKNLLVNPSLPDSPGVDTYFSGMHATAAFDAIGGASYTGQKVPVENQRGGDGTRDAHWRESVFRNELMTGFVNQGFNPLSSVTIRSLEDLGYSVNNSAADPFSIGTAARAMEALPTRHLFKDIAPVPIKIGG